MKYNFLKLNLLTIIVGLTIGFVSLNAQDAQDGQLAQNSQERPELIVGPNSMALFQPAVTHHSRFVSPNGAVENVTDTEGPNFEAESYFSNTDNNTNLNNIDFNNTHYKTSNSFIPTDKDNLLENFNKLKDLNNNLNGVNNMDKLLTDASFWLDRFKEHLIYLDAAVGNSDARAKLAKDIDDLKLKLKNNSDNLSSDFKEQYKKLINNLKDAQNKAKAQAPNNKIVQGLVHHMDEESDYALSNINGIKRTPEEEAKFWKNHDSEVNSLGNLVKSGTQEEKQLFDKLVALGIKDHEAKEDAYAEPKFVKAILS